MSKHCNGDMRFCHRFKFCLFGTVKDFPECEVRAQCYYLLGRALNIHPAFNPEAEEALSKAIKLDPSLVNAWNELGECFWKKNDMEEAKNCFNGALKRVSFFV